MSDSKVVDLLAYKYGKKASDSHVRDALKYLFAKQRQKKTTAIEWTSVSDRLPRGDSKGWFVVLLETVGTLRTIGSSQFINGEWLQIREGLVLVTHWAEMPKELP